VDHRQQNTGYPPSVYMQPFFPCSSDAPCTRTDNFRLDPVPNGCCILTVTNGDGRGTDEVRSYEMFLNGKRVVPADHSRNAQAPVKVLRSNTVKVILTGEPYSKVFVLIAYDPQQAPVTLWMDWRRGDPYYGADFIELRRPCEGTVGQGCECTAEFKVISSKENSKEFADYVASFANTVKCP